MNERAMLTEGQHKYIADALTLITAYHQGGITTYFPDSEIELAKAVS